MSYDPTIPNPANQVRGASGDLAKMQQNFAALAPVALSGLHGLVSGGSPASGAVLVLVSGDTSSPIHYRVLDVGDLPSAAGAIAGQVLVSDGAGNWSPADQTGSGGGGGGGGGGAGFDGVERSALIALPSGATQSFADNTNTVVTGMEVLRNVGGFTINAASGYIEIPSGVTHLEVATQLRFFSNSTGIRVSECFYLTSGGSGPEGRVISQGVPSVTGAPTVALAVTPVFAISGANVSGAAAEPTTEFAARLRPGDRLYLRGRQNSGGPLNVQAGFNSAAGHIAQTWISVRAHKLAASEPAPLALDDLTDVDTSGATSGNALVYNGSEWVPGTVSGGGGGGGSAGAAAAAVCTYALASGSTQTVSTAASPTQTVPDGTILTGLNEVKANVGGFLTEDGMITVPVGSGYTHATVTAQVAFLGNVFGPSGTRGAEILEVSGAVFDAALRPVARVPVSPEDEATIVDLSAPLVPISGGEAFRLRAFSTQGGNATVGWPSFLSVRCYTLSGA